MCERKYVIRENGAHFLSPPSAQSQMKWSDQPHWRGSRRISCKGEDRLKKWPPKILSSWISALRAIRSNNLYYIRKYYIWNKISSIRRSQKTLITCSVYSSNLFEQIKNNILLFPLTWPYFGLDPVFFGIKITYSSYLSISTLIIIIRYLIRFDKIFCIFIGFH